jgi:hypothetical protein
MKNNYKLFWGDLHNHNAVGYAKGSLERSIDIAREHLDFFAFTGHASWHDMPLMPGDRHMHWVNGFKAHTDHWPKTRSLLREANTRDFVALLGYEWHSSVFGDYCLIFPEDQPDLYLPDHVTNLLSFAKEKGAFAIPHHVAYKQGWRGANWDYFDPEVSPVVEIFSEHGCTESDRAPFPMVLHSNGGRSTSNTVDFQLKRAKRFGFVASTDDHFGYPGAWGEGVVGVWAEELTPAAIFDAVRARRTIAATGDRISLDFTLNGLPMGTEHSWTAERRFDAAVRGQDGIKMIELVKNGRVIRRAFPGDTAPERPVLPGRAKCRIQYGWGPWSTLKLERICNWDMTVSIEGGRFLDGSRCFQSGPFAEGLRDRLERKNEKTYRLRSFTSRNQAYLEDPTKAVVFEIEGHEGTELTVELAEPSRLTSKVRLGDLAEDNSVTFTGVFTTESFVIHRLVGPEESEVRVSWEDAAPAGEKAPAGDKVSNGTSSDWYYVRVTQDNGQLAWSSPVWVG